MLMHTIAIVPILLLTPGDAMPATQSDWSGGPGATDPVTAWSTTFAAGSQVNWRGVPGRLSLSGSPLATPTAHLVADDAGYPSAVACGDLDGDGRADLITTDPVFAIGAGALEWWRLDDEGVWHRMTVSDDVHGAHFAGTADIDGDGDLDIYACAYYGATEVPLPPPSDRNGRYLWFENVNGDGSHFEQHIVGELFWGAEFVDVADVDGDGRLDLAGASWLTNRNGVQQTDVVWFRNPGPGGGAWVQHSVATEFLNAHCVRLGDLDGDGDVDIIASQQSTLAWWENVDGTGTTLTMHDLPSPFIGAATFDLADLDGDGALDVAGSALSSSAANLGFTMHNAGDAATWSVATFDLIDNCTSFACVDLDGDGDLDVLSSGGSPASPGHTEWYENSDGSGTAWTKHLLDDDTRRNPHLAAGDVDGDGRLEIIQMVSDSENPGGALLEWDITTFLPAGQLTSAVLDGGAAPTWNTVQWDADVPANTALTVQVRAGDSAGALGAFTTVTNGAALGAHIDPAARFLQYRLQLQSSAIDRSPVVREIAIGTRGAQPGDLNGDGVVDFTDLVTLLSAWDATDDRADLDDDGVVAFGDLVILLSLWST